MSCTAAPISIGPISLTVETITTALSVIAAFYFLDAFTDDLENLQELGENYLQIGKEYCEASDHMRERSLHMFEFIRQLPEYVPHDNYSREAYASVNRAVFDRMSAAMPGVSGDDIGTVCTIKREGALILLEHGKAALADGQRYEKTLDERYIESIVKARTDAVSQNTPNISRSLSLVADTLSRSALENADSFNGALYVAGRGIGTLVNRARGTAPTAGI